MWCVPCLKTRPAGTVKAHPTAKATAARNIALSPPASAELEAMRVATIASRNDAKPRAVLPAVTPVLVIGMIFVALMAAWLVVQTVLTWMAYEAGYIGLLVPVWNLAFDLGVVGVLVGVFMRLDWARRWAIGISLFNGISNMLGAVDAGAAILWVGVLVQAACALVLVVAKNDFGKHEQRDNVAAQLGKFIATLAIVGSIVVGVVARSSFGGSERGRASFAQELQQTYQQQGLPVSVEIRDLDLVIEAPSDSAAQIDAAADMFQHELDRSGRNAKAWVVGFKRMIVTNRRHERVVKPLN